MMTATIRIRTQSPAAKAHQRAYQKAYHATPEAQARERARQRTPEAKAVAKVRKATPKSLARHLAGRHGVPIEIPTRPRLDRCECCGEISATTLHLDHCHDSGRFRGWCCARCNTGVGIMDNAKLCRLRALYLERPLQPGPNWTYPKNWKVEAVS